jgi:hypothetical protein
MYWPDFRYIWHWGLVGKFRYVQIWLNSDKTRIIYMKTCVFHVAASDLRSTATANAHVCFHGNAYIVFITLNCHWNFSLTQSFRPHYGAGDDSASNRNEYQEHFLWGKGGQWVRMTTLLPSCLEIWEPQPPGNLWACNRPVQRLLCLLTDSHYVRQQNKANELLRFHGNHANHCKCWVSSRLQFETQSLLKTSLHLFRYNFGLNHYMQLSY